MSTSSGSWITGEVRLTPEDEANGIAQVEADLAPRYRVRGYLGQGGFATVWHAEDSTGELAIKRFHAPSLKPRSFYRELNVLLRLKHEHIVRAINLLEAPSGIRYLMLEYCPGGTLRPVLSQARRSGRPLAVEEVLRLGLQLGTALEAAHALGIVHRDIKPENILFVAPPKEGRPLPAVKLADFGLARLMASAPRQGALIGLSGSPAYMAPEMFLNEYSPASDWYSLGVVLFEAATGSLPFLGTTEELARYHLRERPPLESLEPKLRELLSPLLQKQPTDRPSPAHWLDQLRLLLPESAVDRLAPEDLAALQHELHRLDPILAALTALRRGRKPRSTDSELLAHYGFTTATTHPTMNAVMDWTVDEAETDAEDHSAATSTSREPQAVAVSEDGATVESVLGQFDWS